jgi:hydrogenase expression/formation protein HypE
VDPELAPFRHPTKLRLHSPPLRGHTLGADAVRIGEIRTDPPGIVVLLTQLGGTRIVDMLVGDPLPRIC